MSRVAKEDPKNMTAVFPAAVKGAALSLSLYRAVMTSSFFRIQVHPAPHLPPEAAAGEAQSFTEAGTRCATTALC